MGSSRTLDNIMLFDGCFDELQEDLYLPGQLPEPASTSTGASIYVDPSFMQGGRAGESATTTPSLPSPPAPVATKQKKPSKKSAAAAAVATPAAQPQFAPYFGPQQAQQMYFQHVQHIQQQQMYLQQQQQPQMAAPAAVNPPQALTSQAVKNQLKSKLKNQQAKQAQAQAQAQAMIMMQPNPFFMAPQYMYPAAAPALTTPQGVKEEAHSGGSEDEDPEEQDDEDNEEDEDDEDDQDMELGGGSFDPNESFVDEALAFDPPELGDSKLEHLSPSYPISPPSTSSSSSSPPPFGGTDSDSDSSSGHTLAQSPFMAPNSWQPAGPLDPADETRGGRPMSAMMESWPSKVAINRLPMMPPPPKNPKRSSHNAIERRYRDNINHKIIELRNAVPTNDHDEKLNKGKVLKKATDYIYYLCNYNHRLKEENTRLREMLLSTGGNEILKRYDQEVITRERAEMESERQEDAKGKKKKEPRQTKAKMADGVRVFVISAAFIGLFFSSPFTMKSASLGPFQSRVLESADPESASSMDFLFQNGLEYVSWFALRFILLTLGLFSVLLGDPITSVDSDAFASSTEKLEQSQVSVSQGNAQLGRQLLAEALSYLGRPLPVSFNDQFFGFLWQLFRQISHFFLIGFWLDRLMAQRTCHTRNSYQQAAQLHYKLLQLDLSNYDSQTLDHLARLTNTLAAVNLMEAVEVDSAVLAKVYASTALLLRLSLPRRLHFLSRYYLNLARKELQSTSNNDPSLSAWLSSSAGYRFFMSNSWVPSMTDNSSVLPKSPMDPLQKFTRLFHENLLFTAFSSLSKESSSTSLRFFEEVTSSASLSKDPVSLWWATMGQVFSLWKMGKIEEGNQKLLKTETQFVPQTRLQLAANYTAFGQMLFRHQQPIPAMKSIDQVSALLEAHKANNPEFTVCGAEDLALDPVIEALCASVVLDIRLSAWQQLLLQATEESKKQTLLSLIQISQRDLEVFKRASNHTAKLSNSAKLFMYKGTIRTLMGGSTPRTRSLFEKGCKIAHAEGSSFTEALILKTQAKFSQTGGEEKKKLLKQALSKFQEVEAIEEAKLTEALLL